MLSLLSSVEGDVKLCILLFLLERKQRTNLSPLDWLGSQTRASEWIMLWRVEEAASLLSLVFFSAQCHTEILFLLRDQRENSSQDHDQYPNDFQNQSSSELLAGEISWLLLGPRYSNSNIITIHRQREQSKKYNGCDGILILSRSWCVGSWYWIYYDASCHDIISLYSPIVWSSTISQQSMLTSKQYYQFQWGQVSLGHDDVWLMALLPCHNIMVTTAHGQW